jgi:oligoendopeptidase F
MKKQLPKRHELEVKHTWDMSHLFKDESLYQQEFDQVEKDVDLFSVTYEHKLKTKEIINESLLAYQNIKYGLYFRRQSNASRTRDDAFSSDIKKTCVF